VKIFKTRAIKYCFIVRQLVSDILVVMNNYKNLPVQARYRDVHLVTRSGSVNSVNRHLVLYHGDIFDPPVDDDFCLCHPTS